MQRRQLRASSSQCIESRKIWRCKACSQQFSVTSGTVFAYRKLPIATYPLAIAIFVNGAKVHSALQMSRDLDCQYKSAYVLCHKLREAIAIETAETKLAGTVEIDGAYFGGYVKLANHKENRVDRRKAENQTGKRRVVVVMRERNGTVLPFVFRTESQWIPAIMDRVSPLSIVHADDATSWNALHDRFLTKRINHQECYSDGEACANQAESLFSRLRRAEIGTHNTSPAATCTPTRMRWRGARTTVASRMRVISEGDGSGAQCACISDVEGVLAAQRVLILSL